MLKYFILEAFQDSPHQSLPRTVAKGIVDIRCGRLFPVPFLVLGAVSAAAGVMLFSRYPIVSAILVLAGIAVFTACEGTEIDPAARTYREYSAFLFMKNGRKKPFTSIEKIYINSAKVTQRFYTAHTSSSSTFTNREYNAYLKLSGGVRVFLASDRDKGRLLSRFGAIAPRLNTTVTDVTQDQ